MLITLQKNTLLHILNSADTFAQRYHSAILWISAAAYKLLLDWVYVTSASPLYEVSGLVMAPSAGKLLLGTVLYFFLFWMLPKEEHSIGSLWLNLQFALTIAPMLVFYGWASQSTAYLCMVVVCAVLQCVLIRRPQTAKPVVFTGIRSYMTVAMGLAVIATLVIPFLYNGFPGLKIFDLSYIYIWRRACEYPSGFGYLLNWTAMVIVPFFILMAIHHKKYLAAMLGVLIQVLLFMESSSKFYLGLIVALIGIYIVSITGHTLKLAWIGFCALTLFNAMTARFYTGFTSIFGNIWAVRILFHPADNKFNYYDCYSVFPKVFFSDGLFGRLFSLTDPYTMSLGQVSYVFQGGEPRAVELNTGYLGDSYAQMGFLGMLLMSVLLVLIIRVLCLYSTKKNFGVLAALSMPFIFILNDGALFTVLMTSGLMVAFILIAIYMPERGIAKHGI